MPRALVFDIGNTLVRTADAIESAYLAVFARHGIPAETIRLFKRFAGRPKHVLFAEALRAVPGRQARGGPMVSGDTPQDVKSARAAGAVSVAVATGKFGREELAAHRPQFILG